MLFEVMSRICQWRQNKAGAEGHPVFHEECFCFTLQRLLVYAIRLDPNDEILDEVDLMRLNNLSIEFFNAQRSYCVRALTDGEQGLAQQAVTSVARSLT